MIRKNLIYRIDDRTDLINVVTWYKFSTRSVAFSQKCFVACGSLSFVGPEFEKETFAKSTFLLLSRQAVNT